MAQGTAATVGLQSILNANPVWTRNDLGDMDALIKDVEANGIKVPVVVMPDMLVIAGARRVEAAKALKMDQVPVVIVLDWPQTMAAITAGREDSYPMTWAELIDWWDNILKPVNQKYRYTQSAVETRRRNRRSRSEALPVDQYIASGYSQFTQQLAEIHDVAPSIIKTLRDVWTQFQALKQDDRVFYTPMLKVINEAMVRVENRDMDYARFLKSAMRLRGQIPNSDPQPLVDRFRNAMFGGHNPGQRRSSPERIASREAPGDLTAPLVTKLAIENLVATLEQLATVGHTFNNFSGLNTTEAKVYGARVDTACRKLQKMRRLMQNMALKAAQAEV